MTPKQSIHLREMAYTLKLLATNKEAVTIASDIILNHVQVLEEILKEEEKQEKENVIELKHGIHETKNLEPTPLEDQNNYLREILSELKKLTTCISQNGSIKAITITERKK